jgi:hypothetical protein
MSVEQYLGSCGQLRCNNSGAAQMKSRLHSYAYVDSNKAILRQADALKKLLESKDFLVLMLQNRHPSCTMVWKGETNVI